MKDEAAKWVRIAEGDLAAASVLLERGDDYLLRHSVFHCHEAIEKILKAIWVESRGEEPERTHNLPYLVEKLGIQLPAEDVEFVRDLYLQLIPSRYPHGQEIPRDEAARYLEEARRLFAWLRRMLK